MPEVTGLYSLRDSNKRIFTYLRGILPYTRDVDEAQLRIVIDVKLDSGEPLKMGPCTIPFATFSAEKGGV